MQLKAAIDLLNGVKVVIERQAEGGQAGQRHGCWNRGDTTAN